MADYISTQSGDWNTAATWGGGGHPDTNGDTATIADGHEVDYNLGVSAIEFGNVTINAGGTLTFPTGSNSKIIFEQDAVFSISGTLNAGASGTPVDASYTCIFEFVNASSARDIIDIEDGSTVNIYGDPDFYGDEKYAEVKTEITLDGTDDVFTVTGDYTTKWVAGQKIFVAQNCAYKGNPHLTACNIFEIESVSANGADTDIEIVDQGGDTNTYYVGGRVVMLSRNVIFREQSVSWAIGAYTGHNNRIDYNKSVDEVMAVFDNCLFIGWGALWLASGGYLITEDVVYVNVYSSQIAGFQYADYISMYYATASAYPMLKGVFGGISNFPYSSGVSLKGGSEVWSCTTLFPYSDGVAKEVKFRTFRYLVDTGRSILFQRCELYNFQTLFSSSGNRRAGVISLENCDVDGTLTEFEMYCAFGEILALHSGDGEWQAPDSGQAFINKMIPDTLTTTREDYTCRFAFNQRPRWFAYVQSGSNTITMKVYPVGWSTGGGAAGALDQDDLYLKAWYLDAGSGVSVAEAVSTSQSFANGGWREISVTFTAGQAGVVYFDLLLSLYESGDYVLVDPEWALS